MTTQTVALNELLEPVGRCLDFESAQKLVGVRAPQAVQRRMQQFAAKSNAGRLSKEEQTEYETLVSVGTFIAILQSKARMVLRESAKSE